MASGNTNRPGPGPGPGNHDLRYATTPQNYSLRGGYPHEQTNQNGNPGSGMYSVQHRVMEPGHPPYGDYHSGYNGGIPTSSSSHSYSIQAHDRPIVNREVSRKEQEFDRMMSSEANTPAYGDHRRRNANSTSTSSSHSHHSHHSSASHDKPFMERDTLREDQFDERQLGQSPSDDEVRPSNNQTPIVTEVHNLPQSRYQMPHHYSYHGDISGQEAERILRSNSKRNSYLTRFSNNSRKYMLTVIYIYQNREQVANFAFSTIDTVENKYSLEGTGIVFSSLDTLLEYYETKRLNPEIRNIGSACPADTCLSQQPSESQITKKLYKELEALKKEFYSRQNYHVQQPNVPPEADVFLEVSQSQPNLREESRHYATMPRANATASRTNIAAPQADTAAQANNNEELKSIKELLREQQKTIKELQDDLAKKRCTIL